MIGAAGRKVGKTEFACAVLRRYASSSPLVAVKVTAVTRPGECCPRGGQGCGICGDLNEPYLISREESREGDKDTSRLLAAGASKVYWLRSRRDALLEGLTALLARIPAGTAIACESNSSRLVLEPGLFLVLRAKRQTRIKESCRQVIDLADRICDFEEEGWDLAPNRLVFAEARWTIRPEAGAIVLAGGKSSRMGQDKSLLPFGERPLVQRVVDQLRPLFDEVILGADKPERFAFLGLKIVPDELPDQGPLMGIVSCLSKARFDLNFVTGCDVPSQHADLIMKMLMEANGVDVVMPRSADGRLEPLFAVYRKSVIAPCRSLLADGKRRITELLPLIRVNYIKMPDADWYRNINTIEEYRAALKQSPD